MVQSLFLHVAGQFQFLIDFFFGGGGGINSFIDRKIQESLDSKGSDVMSVSQDASNMFFQLPPV